MSPVPLSGRELFEHPIAPAVMEVLRERGYRGASSEEFARRAGIERLEFERLFRDRDDAILRVYEAFIDDFMARVQAAFQSVLPWPANLRAAAYEVTRWMRDYPSATWFGNVGIAEAPELGRVRREELFKWCAELIDRGREVAPDPAAVPEAAPLIAVGAVIDISRRQQQGSLEVDPAAMVPSLMYAAVRPYLGEEAALRELEIPPPPDLAAVEPREGPRGRDDLSF